MPPPDETPVLSTVRDLSALALRTYRVNPGLVEEHANGERRITQGGYGDRQLFELVQNAADELQTSPGGRVHVALTRDHLYCANEGSAVTPAGAETILRMGVSRKRGGQIGRFGVGVKSVLSVTRTPQFFSTSGSFGFDADWSAQEILKAVNDGRIERGESLSKPISDAPVLRLARPLDVDRERAADPVLHELLSWATTVVRLPLLPGAATRLGEDIFHQAKSSSAGERREFPRLFQLFSNHVGVVRLEDRRQMPYLKREILVEHGGIHHVIRESRSGAKQVEVKYRVFTRPHQVTDESRGSAGELHDRVTIDVSWAVPDYTSTDRGVLTVPSERGTFWSFFPTKYPTTLSGALNAAWKTNEDRQNLLDGSPLNRELLRVAAELVVDSLTDLVPAKDPAAYLPLLPGRTRESPNWACEYLTAQVWKLAAVKPSLPDQDGILRLPKDVRIHPATVSARALELWRSYAGRPTNWVHHSVEADRNRRGKVGHILDAAGIKEEESLRSWLEALVADGTAASSAAAIRLLANLVQDPNLRTEELAEARNARVVLTERHGFVAPTPGNVFRRADEDGLRDDLVYVHPEISDEPSMTLELDRIGIRKADTQGRFQSVLDQGFDDYTDESWTRFWELMRTAGGVNRVSDIKRKVQDVSAVIRVKTVVGAFRPLRDCLLPGPVVPADGSRDGSFAVDIAFHGDDITTLRDLGMTDRPQRGHRPELEEWFAEYHEAVYDAYCRQLDATARRIQLQTLKVDGASVAGPLNLFTRLSEEGRAAFLAAVPEDGLIETWVRQEGKTAGTRVAVSSPIRWLLRKYGRVNTSKGLIPLRDAVGPQLRAYDKVLPVAELSPAKAQRLGLPTRVEEVKPARWTELLAAAKASEDPSFVGHAYALLIRVDFDFSEELAVRCRVGDRWEMRPDKEVAVAVSVEEFDDLCREGHPALLVDSPEDHEQAEFMISAWGMSRVSEVIEKGLRFVPGGPAVPLVDEYPPLRQRGIRANGQLLQRCSVLEEVVRTPSGSREKPLHSARQENTVLVLENASREEALIAADREFGWRLGPTGCRQILAEQRRQQENRAHQERRKRIRDTDSVIDKISLLISPGDLKRGLPAGLIDSEIAETGAEPELRRLAEMAYNAHGEGILRVHAKDIAAKYQGAPSTFDGRSKALEFVADLGFPDSFAGARTPSPPEREEVKGPTEFPALHAYQEELASELTKLLQSTRPQRAMLSLPTGAGKTRVTAEGVIRWIRRSGTPNGPILWIAQTEELCEQAVQSWRFVWEKVGADQPLVIDRLWSGNSATPVSGRPHLVVATDAKLRLHLGTPAYDWLRQAALVLVDEAHVAISSLYTEILEHLGLTHRETRRHLVGLTATPFRNNAELTRRLVQRFGNLRLDEDVFEGEAIVRLQELGVLAQVEHRQLAGAEMQLNSDELRTIEQFNGFLPKGAEQRLADDQGRNHVLIEEIVRVAKDGPVLVFATSVPHAKFLAAKLGDRGIRAAAIDAATPTAERSKRVEAFRKGEIRVITNYGVLSQGFDAPATRAVVIARPVYSANVYQQMIGRGLRGPRNGGKETCLILDVRDNITNFNKDLAFRDFEHLWKKERP